METYFTRVLKIKGSCFVFCTVSSFPLGSILVLMWLSIWIKQVHVVLANCLFFFF